MKAYLCLNCQTRQVSERSPVRCMKCGAASAFLREELALPGFEHTTSEREEERLKAEGEALSAKLREPGRDVSAKAGQIERDSPLFRGTGDNPLLF